MSIDRRPNRSHGAIYQLPDEVRSWIDERLVSAPRWTYEQIADHLREEWETEITPQQLSRYFRREGPWLERHARVRELMGKLRSQFGDADVDPGIMDLAEMLLLEILVNVEPQNVGSVDDLMKVIGTLSKLKTSRVQVERLKIQMGKAVEKAFTNLIEKMRTAVGAGRPELLAGLVELAEQARTELIEEL
ncbi:MAG: phage protein Gp27 family protein [Thermodesulfobacteriota bacterium]